MGAVQEVEGEMIKYKGKAAEIKKGSPGSPFLIIDLLITEQLI